MELSSRKRAVLSAIIKAYIETGEPVGSKILTSLIENSPSSATIRNEMNELCTLGFLTQPHTSAGRIPTSLGYKMYVDGLSNPEILPPATKDYINSLFCTTGNEAQAIPINAADALSELTGYPAVSCYIVEPNVFLKQVQLLPVSRKTAILLAVFSDGRTYSRVCHIPTGVGADLTESFFSLVKQRLLKKPLAEFNKAQLQSIIASSGINSLSLMPLLTTLFDMALSASESTVRISGAAALYNFCTETDARRIASMANHPESVINILDNTDNDSGVIFGNDTNAPELKNKVIIFSKYYCADRYCGKIGIIGPDRLVYDQIIPSVKYTAERLSRLLTQTVNDMED